jgi:SAM-dependent methyltransferase
MATPGSLARRVRAHLSWRAARWHSARGPHAHWLRMAMLRDTQAMFEALDPPSLHVAEISGSNWTALPWGSRTQLDFPSFDLCRPPPELPGPFDLVICEQVLEHVPDPLTAVHTLRRLCKDSGHVYVSTPFLVRLHRKGSGGDYWRFTPDGMALLLRSQGLKQEGVFSWGNRKAILANFDKWVRRLPWQSLRNEPDLPAMVWALARPAPPPREPANLPLATCADRSA